MKIVDLEEPGPRYVQAQYDGRCIACDEEILEGDEIAYSEEWEGWGCCL